MCMLISFIPTCRLHLLSSTTLLQLKNANNLIQLNVIFLKSLKMNISIFFLIVYIVLKPEFTDLFLVIYLEFKTI